MKAVRYEGNERIAVIDTKTPELNPGDVCIRVTHAGICGTDLTIVAGGIARVPVPLIMGHEFAGTVAALPDDDTSGLQVGNRVTVYPLISCGTCYVCQAGTPHVCRNLGLYGVDTAGGFAEYVTVAHDAVFKLPDSVDDVSAALIEPLSVAIHDVRRSFLEVGDNVVVTGAGPIGLLIAMLARLGGAATVVLTEVSAERLRIARELDFVAVDASQDNLVSAVLEHTNGRGADVLFEATGHPSVAEHLLDLVKTRGQILQVGIPKKPMRIDLQKVVFNEVTITGARVYERSDYARAIELAAQGKIDLNAIVTHSMSINDAAAAFDAARGGSAVKVILEMGAN